MVAWVAPALAVCTACTPKVVPVTTWPLTVVVTVAGLGLAVVVEQPLHVPDQELNGPQPPVQVDQAQPGPPHGPLLFHPAPGPPQGPPPDCQPPGGPGSAVEQAETHEPQPAEPLPHGPQLPGAPVMEGHALPPDVAE